MIAYILRRIAYAIPILIGVNVITFLLFFVVNTPDDMARMQLGEKRVTEAAIQKWKQERGYDKPVLWNREAGALAGLTDTIFLNTPRACSCSTLAAPTVAAISAMTSASACGRAS